MKYSDGDAHSAAHGFFHTMVVMGSALALGCGGESRSTTGVPEGAAGMNTDGAGGGAGSGGMASGAAGNSALGGGAGSSGAGGTTIISIGGSAGANPVPDCPPAQWNCSNSHCNNENIASPSADCSCDATRPKTAADCAAGETLICLDGVSYDASGMVVQQQVPYQCACVPTQLDCASSCAIAQPGLYNARCVVAASGSSSDPILCECAPVVLK